MTAFFIGGSPPADSNHLQAAYGALRERSRLAVGCPAKRTRIFKLECRLEGQDCEIEVGHALPGGDDVVVAILDHGRDEPFVVYTEAEPGGIHVSRPVYSVTEFS